MIQSLLHNYKEECFSSIYYILIGKKYLALPFLRKNVEPSERKVLEWCTLLRKKLNDIFYKDFTLALEHSPDKKEAGFIEKNMDDPDESQKLYLFINGDKSCLEEIMLNIRSSFEYGIHFLFLFNDTYNLIEELLPSGQPELPESKAAKDCEVQDKIYLLAAASHFDKNEDPYIWEDRPFPGYQSSLLKKGERDYRFILNAKKGTFKNSLVRITLKHKDGEEEILEETCLSPKKNIVITYNNSLSRISDVMISIKNLIEEE